MINKILEWTGVITAILYSLLVAFNIGVEIGQLLALSAILILISYWRKQPTFITYSYSTNIVLSGPRFKF